uniref:TEP1-F n=1 Tax=Glossina palpalis gambiensis TaxID=67801 RepID=A0A1B0BJ29_9MUSC
MFQNFYLVYCILHMIWLARGNGIYSIVAPKTLQSNHKYSVSVTLHDAKQPVKFNIGITGPSYNHSEVVTLSAMETTQIDFVLPKLDGGPYRLISKGIEGLDFENATELHVAQSTTNVYIQTDKAMYKPGDIMQYRILILDENLRPTKLKEPSLKVTIKDPENNLVRDTKNVKLIKGVFSDKLQLTEQPVLGLWNIEVSLKDHVKMTKEFEVAKYVLPKFSVDIDTVTDLVITENFLKATVRAKYTYGKPVKGKATVRVSPVNLEKTIDVNGKGHVEFDLQKELKSALKGGFVEIFVVVQEELTDNRQNNTIIVNLHSSQYTIKVPNAVREFEPNKPFEVKAVIKYINGKPVQDAKNPALLQCSQGWGENIKSEIFKAKLDDHGEAIFQVNLPEPSVYRCEIEFADKTVQLPPIYRKIDEDSVWMAHELTLSLVNKTLRVGDDVSISVKAPNPLSYLVYVIVGRGNIVQMRNIALSNPQNFYTITFKSTFEMMPNAHVFVYYVDKGDLKFQEIDVKIQPEFENKIEITGPSQAKPGQEVSLNVKTDPNSYVGLLGVDQSVLLLKSGNDLHLHAILNDLKPYKNWEENEWLRNAYKVPGKKSGLLVMTNSHYPYQVVLYMMDSAPLYLLRGPVAETTSVSAFRALPSVPLPAPLMRSAEPQRIRKDFAEVWLFDSLDDNNKTGLLTLAKTLPDTITSWVISGFAVSEKTGLGMTEKPFKINVFQPFFIDVNLPYSVKRGEVIAIPVIIFNYMDKTLDAEITMDNTDKEYDFTEVSNEIEESILSTQKRMKRVSVPPNSGESVSFMIRPAVVADIELKISAASQLAGDAIHKKLKVEAEGVTQYENQALFLNLEKPQKASLQVAIPPEAVKDSEYVEFSVKYAELYQKQIEKCLEYVVSQLENEKNSYALSIAAAALHKANHTAADRVLEKLQAEAKEENGFKWWTSANHNDIEITAYALQTLVDTEPINQILPIIKWLIGQRNSNGGFDSTQNTVVGLEALIKFSKKFSITGNSKMSITFKAFDDGKKELTQHRFEVNKDNSLVLQTRVLPKSTRSLSLEAEGAGSSLIQLSYQYNLATKDDRPGFKLDIKPKILPSQQLQINICANYQPAVDDEINESNMAVMEVALPSGYVADSEKFNDILAADRVQRVDTESSDTKVIVYLDGLVEDEQVCVTIVADKAFAVAKQKPVPVTLYDYYNSAYRGTEYYRIESSLCDICEGDDCGTACK